MRYDSDGVLLEGYLLSRLVHELCRTRGLHWLVQLDIFVHTYAIHT